MSLLSNSKSDVAIGSIKDHVCNEEDKNNNNNYSNSNIEVNEVNRFIAQKQHERIHPFVRLFTMYETNLPRLL